MESPKLKISVCITSYNQKDYLIEAIDSVLNQTLKPCEIIIVDDYSTDGSQQTIREYAAKHKDLIRPFYSERNLGYPKTRNIALEQIRGELVCYLDGDDRFLPRKLELEAEAYLRNPDNAIVFSNFFYIDSKGKRLKIHSVPKDFSGTKNGNFFVKIFSQSIDMRNRLLNYECFKQVGFLDPRFSVWSDWDLTIRLTKRFKVVYCPEPLVEYRIHEKGLHAAPSYIHIRLILKIYKKNRHLLKDRLMKEQIMVTMRVFYVITLFALSAALEKIGVKKAGAVIMAGTRCMEYWILRLRDNACNLR